MAEIFVNIREEPMMFKIEKEALQYIKLRSNSVVIDLKSNPASGG
jgi:hypothetical protein